MRLMCKNICLSFFVIFTFLIIIANSIASEKLSTVKRSAVYQPHDSAIVNIGNLHNYVSNKTITWLNEYNLQTFIIGREDKISAINGISYPSMLWLEGGYENNCYLYYGAFWIGYNNNTIRFNGQTSNDFTVIRNDISADSPFEISFSITDELADSLNKVGVKCICRVHAWPEPYRDDYLIYEYLIINKSTDVLTDVYAALHMDADVSSAGGGSSETGFWRDDIPDYYLGIDDNGEPESISFMYDGDSPYFSGDDTGGRFDPKESLGYIGSRVLRCPPTKNLVPANQQSGHQWWGWGNVPMIGNGYFYLMKKSSFSQPPDSPHDYRFIQTLGPWDIHPADTLHLAFSIGIGEGLGGLRANLQTAYDQYWSNFAGPSAPYIQNFYPEKDTVTVYFGEMIRFEVEAVDKEGKELIYTWKINDLYSVKRESFYVFSSADSPLGINTVLVEVTDNQFISTHKWMVTIKPAKKYELYQNYPNPFNNGTQIPFELKEEGRVIITIYDIQGRKIKTLLNNDYPFGKHEISWEGTDAHGRSVASGLYFYQIKTGSFTAVKRMLLLR